MKKKIEILLHRRADSSEFIHAKIILTGIEDIRHDSKLCELFVSQLCDLQDHGFKYTIMGANDEK